jgi:S-adenosyl-L-methionine hydrolase (adenosine-forming)
MAAVITLTTDFGLEDAYVAIMKGVILGINPAATLVDISHAVRPQDIRQAAFILGTAFPFFPPRSVHLAVVDPGVGTARQAIILRTPRADFVAPDNGILSYVLQEHGTATAGGGRARLLPGVGLEAVAITEPKFRRSPVSATFHGRDIFAPAAAHLSLGVPLAELGETLSELTVFPIATPQRAPDGTLTGSVLHIDRFGNLITNIRGGDLAADAASLKVNVGGEVIRGLNRTYHDGGGLLALIGSSDRLEISLPDGNAAALIHAEIGDEIRVKSQI